MTNLYEDIFKQVSEDLNIPVDTVRLAYKTYWKFIKEHISELPLKEDLTEGEFNELRTCFNVPSLGKLTCTLDRYIGMKKRFEYLNKLRSRRND